MTRRAGGIPDVETLTDPDVLETYRRDQAAPGLLPAGTPAVVARPTTTAEVQAAVRWAAAEGMAIVPRGAGSGLSGGANALDGGLVLSLERMDAVAEVDAAALTATVAPGVVNDALRAAAAEHDLLYAPDPASAAFCTIGGNVATNAGGLCCVKYGVTRDSLLELEVVLADGRVVTVGRRTRKGVVGYDLVGLLCGSEGTLGIVTRATVRLLPRPGRAATLAASFASLEAAAAASTAIAGTLRPSLLELVDRTTIDAVEALQPMGLDREAGAMLFARSDAGGAHSDAEVARMAAVCDAHGSSIVVTSDEEAEGRMLLAARRLAYPALERLGATLLDDVCVPLPAIAALVRGVEAIAERHALVIGTFGHAGDGNLHPTIVYDARDPGETARAQAAFADIVALALELGGTASGEHGVGLLKRDLAARELGAALDVHRAVKRALDPDGRLNPGRAL